MPKVIVLEQVLLVGRRVTTAHRNVNTIIRRKNSKEIKNGETVFLTCRETKFVSCLLSGSNALGLFVSFAMNDIAITPSLMRRAAIAVAPPTCGRTSTLTTARPAAIATVLTSGPLVLLLAR